MKLAAVHLAGRGAALVHTIEEVPDDLVRDEQTQEVGIADREESSRAAPLRLCVRACG